MDTVSLSRRDFLRTSTVVGGGVLSGGLGIARSAHAAGSDQIKIALVGCGGRGRGAAANCLDVKDNIKLIAVADAFEDAARQGAVGLKQQYGAKVDLPPERIFWGFDAYQKALQAGPDLVLLVTPPGFRPLHYRAVVEAGKHVFMEKPCCVDAPGFRSLQETNKLAEEKGLKVAVGLNMRHAPGFHETIKRIHEGTVGAISFMRCYGNNSGVWVRPRRSGQTEMEYQIRNWYYFTWLSGDLIVEQTVHEIDMANWAQCSHPVEANGMGGRQVRTGKDHGQIFDHHFIEYTYADGVKLFCQARHIGGCFNSGAVAVHGSLGLADCEGRIAGEHPWRYAGPQSSGHAQEHVDLIAAIRNGEKYHEGWYGATSSMTAVLGRMATYSGQVVRWDDAVAKGTSEMPKRYAFDAEPPVRPDAQGNYPVPVPGVYRAY
ncbi:MAG: Gfo/Idh/MocA family oxidoreductase [Thermoguttaceae bacterium]|jgi:predicted dehydrogenase